MQFHQIHSTTFFFFYAFNRNALNCHFHLYCLQMCLVLSAHSVHSQYEMHYELFTIEIFFCILFYVIFYFFKPSFYVQFSFRPFDLMFIYVNGVSINERKCIFTKIPSFLHPMCISKYFRVCYRRRVEGEGAVEFSLQIIPFQILVLDVTIKSK